MTRRLLALIWLGIGGLLFAQPAWALDCEAPTLYYNGDNKKLYAESDLFADTKLLRWGTEVCPIDTHKRWRTTWTKVRLENGDTGWLDQDDLLTVDAFGDVAVARHGTLRRQLQALLSEITQLEVRLTELDREVPDPTLQDVLEPWLPDEPVAESDVGETDAVSEAEATATPTTAPTATATRTPRPTRTATATRTPRPTRMPTATPTPRPTRTPRPTATPTPTRMPTATSTPIPTATAIAPCEAQDVLQYRNTVVPLLDGISAAMGEIGALFSQVSDNTWLLLDEDWVLETTLVLLNVWGYADEIADVSAPLFVWDVHYYILEAADHYRLYATLTLSGLEPLDVEVMTEAAEYSLQGSEALNQSHANWLHLCG